MPTLLLCLTSINSPIMPTETPVFVCVSFSLPLTTMISLIVAHWQSGYSVAPVNQTQQLYCVRRMQQLYSLGSHLSSLPITVSLSLTCPSVSPVSGWTIWCFSAVSLFFSCCFPPTLHIFYSYLRLCLSLWNTSLHQPGLVSSTQWLQHQHPPPDNKTDK